MATEIIMPKLGVDMQEGQIIEWKKKEGDEVKEGEILLEIMSDKTNMELEAEATGTLIKILRKDGETVPVTEVIGYIGKKGEVVGEETKPAEVKEDKKEEKTEKNAKDYDIIVIGGGPAGYYCAIRAAQLGAKALVIEKIEVGGTCLNRGCIPTKTYLKNAEIIENIQHAKKRGIILKDEKYTVDMDKTVDVKNNVVKTLTNGIKGLFRSYGIDCIHGVGKVLKDKTVVVDDKKFTADKIVIATGSKVSKINIPGIESKLVLTSDDILELRQVPESLGIIGGGVVGVELAQAFNSFGSNVTIIEMSDRVVPSCDEEVSQVLRKSLESKGIKILTSSKLNSIEEKEGRLTLKLEGK